MRLKGQPKPGNVSEFHSREGMAWTQFKVTVFDNELRCVETLPFEHFSCRKCNAVVEMDKRGYAFCPCCGLIFNDGIIINTKLSDSAKEVKSDRKQLDLRRFARSMNQI